MRQRVMQALRELEAEAQAAAAQRPDGRTPQISMRAVAARAELARQDPFKPCQQACLCFLHASGCCHRHVLSPKVYCEAFYASACCLMKHPVRTEHVLWPEYQDFLEVDI
eukprot:1154559-Pelagomonas_calceolata.AAC.5